MTPIISAAPVGRTGAGTTPVLKYYESFWSDGEKNTEDYRQLMEHVHELVKVRSQCGRWDDQGKLVEELRALLQNLEN